MKFLIPLLILVGCASNRSVYVGPKPPMAISNDTTIEQINADKGEDAKCMDLYSSRYCRWGKDVMVFKRNKFVEKVPSVSSPKTFNVTADFIKDDSESGNKVYLTPASSKVNVKGIEWGRYHTFLKAVLVSNGFVLVDSAEAADTTVKVDFGVKATKSGADRSLEMSSFDASDKEFWKVSVNSLGESTDLKSVLPVLATVAQGTLADDTESSKKYVVSEDDLIVVAFKHYSKKLK